MVGQTLAAPKLKVNHGQQQVLTKIAAVVVVAVSVRLWFVVGFVDAVVARTVDRWTSSSQASRIASDNGQSFKSAFQWQR